MKESTRLDWNAVRLRLERAGEQLREKETADRGRIYRERAERLARPLDDLENLKIASEIMVFQLGPERYGFPIGDVTEVVEQFKLARVPHAPAWVAGVIQVRGEIFAIYDLREILGTANETPHPGGKVILVRTNDATFGVRADTVDEIRTVRDEDRRPAASTSAAPFVAWMTSDLIRVLHTESLWKREL